MSLLNRQQKLLLEGDSATRSKKTGEAVAASQAKIS